MIDQHHGWNLSTKPLVLGYTVSVLLIVAAYRIVTRYHLTHDHLVYTLFALCATQVVLQLVFFLHVGLESKPAWNLITLLFMLLVVVIVIGGSLWIMHNLKYNVMVPEG